MRMKAAVFALLALFLSPDVSFAAEDVSQDAPATASERRRQAARTARERPPRPPAILEQRLNFLRHELLDPLTDASAKQWYYEAASLIASSDPLADREINFNIRRRGFVGVENGYGVSIMGISCDVGASVRRLFISQVIDMPHTVHEVTRNYRAASYDYARRYNQALIAMIPEDSVVLEYCEVETEANRR